MWLLSTASLELREFSNASQVEGGYAILSHVWQDVERSFQDILRLQTRGIQTYSDPQVGFKIRESVKVAKALGLAWLWIDTCCINKTSSSELEESINSMFRWYTEARVCFAYLHDVPDDCHVEAPDSKFRTSKWFTRGWTLQELIAPRQLIFLSANWFTLGTKAALADVLEEITGVDAGILTFRRALQHVSVARRLAWASRRVTSKVEDEAYSLMGLFDVTMSTIYGEGKNAFRRLQEEIMKRSPDHSLFAWGRTLPAVMPYAPETHRHKRDALSSLFAPSPSSFSDSITDKSARLTPIRLEVVKKIVSSCISVADFKARVLREHTVTSHGVRCHLIVVHGDPFSIALLPCKNSAGECVGLLLWRNPQSRSDLPQYFVGASFKSIGDTGPAVREATGYRLINIRPSTVDAVLNFGRQASSRASVNGSDDGGATGARRARASLEKIYIINTLAAVSSLAHPWMQLSDSEPRSVFIPTWLPTYLAPFGFSVLRRDSPAEPVLGKPTSPPYTLTLVHPDTGERVTITLECRGNSHLCASVIIDSAVRHREGDFEPSIDWLAPLYRPPRAAPLRRISDWKNGSESFGDERRTVRLTATRWPTSDCYHLEIRLEGTVYASLRDANDRVHLVSLDSEMEPDAPGIPAPPDPFPLMRELLYEVDDPSTTTQPQSSSRHGWSEPGYYPRYRSQGPTRTYGGPAERVWPVNSEPGRVPATSYDGAYRQPRVVEPVLRIPELQTRYRRPRVQPRSSPLARMPGSHRSGASVTLLDYGPVLTSPSYYSPPLHLGDSDGDSLYTVVEVPSDYPDPEPLTGDDDEPVTAIPPFRGKSSRTPQPAPPTITIVPPPAPEPIQYYYAAPSPGGYSYSYGNASGPQTILQERMPYQDFQPSPPRRSRSKPPIIITHGPHRPDRAPVPIIVPPSPPSIRSASPPPIIIQRDTPSPPLPPLPMLGPRSEEPSSVRRWFSSLRSRMSLRSKQGRVPPAVPRTW
ncbi:HET-domain-containing protein [Cubamyces sp. BRFM 1775]|nr:HET-domain-containing protein [Cubamyces sp. BRFM 1775]